MLHFSLNEMHKTMFMLKYYCLKGGMFHLKKTTTFCVTINTFLAQISRATSLEACPVNVVTVSLINAGTTSIVTIFSVSSLIAF